MKPRETLQEIKNVALNTSTTQVELALCVAGLCDFSLMLIGLLEEQNKILVTLAGKT